MNKKLLTLGAAAMCFSAVTYAAEPVRRMTALDLARARVEAVRAQYNPFSQRRLPAAAPPAALVRVQGAAVRPPYRPETRSPYQPPVRGPYIASTRE